MAVLFISHDLSLVKRLCDRVIVMHNGSMVETGRTEEIFTVQKRLYDQADQRHTQIREVGVTARCRGGLWILF